MRRLHESASGKRPGAVLIAVLLLLMAVVWIAVELGRGAAIRQRQERRAETAQQAFWLAESAAARGVHGLRNSADYRGETWRVPGDVLDGRPSSRAGRAVIVVETPEGRETLRRIRVEACFPEDDVHAVQCVREWTVELSGDSP